MNKQRGVNRVCDSLLSTMATNPKKRIRPIEQDAWAAMIARRLPSKKLCESRIDVDDDDCVCVAVRFGNNKLVEPIQSQLVPIMLDEFTASSPIQPISTMVDFTVSKPTSSMVEFAMPKPAQPTPKVDNVTIASQLEQLANAYLHSGEKWRAFAYRKAAASVKGCAHPITSAKQARSLPNVGASVAEKIGELIEEQGKLRLLDMMQSDEKTKTLLLFGGIYGVGPATAKRWYDMGYRSLDELQTAAAKLLSPFQMIGLQHYHDLQSRIPRDEVWRIATLVAHAFYAIDSGFKIEVCGSYRRGAKDCGDIDILVTHADTKMHARSLARVVSQLYHQGVLTDHLQSLGQNMSMYKGICREAPNAPHRRIDILTVDLHEWPFALLYFTGPNDFNRAMRQHAKQQGYQLSSHALVKIDDFSFINLAEEGAIFEHLRLPYQMPCERNATSLALVNCE